MKRTCILLAWALLVSTHAVHAGPAPQPLRDWAFEPLSADANGHARPIDAASIDRRLDRAIEMSGLSAATPTARSDLVRRLHVDLWGLLPLEDEIAEVLGDREPEAIEKLVDRLLASPRHGERWARHYMDLVHYAETHGHDEDGIRENAWPYRDYLIASFNEDKPYARFITEQIAGDVLFPDDPAAIVATAFVAVGPWDQSSQAGIQDGTLDKRIAQYMDRDDMLTTTLSTFASASVHCARCHDHKRDPITLEDYYALSAVFAGVDRIDRPYDPDPEVHRRRLALLARSAELDREAAGPCVADNCIVDRAFADADLAARARTWERETLAGRTDWRVLEPERIVSREGSSFEVLPDRSVLFGGGASGASSPPADAYTIAFAMPETFAAPLTGLRLEVLTHESLPASGPGRAVNGNFHLSGIRVRLVSPARKLATSSAATETGGCETFDGEPVQREPMRDAEHGDLRDLPIAEAHADFDQDGWTIAHSIDGDGNTAWGIHPREGEAHEAVFRFAAPITAVAGDRLEVVLEQEHGRAHLIGRPRLSITSDPVGPPRAALAPELLAAVSMPESARDARSEHTVRLAFLRAENDAAIAELPARHSVYAVSTNFEARGNFRPARGPRPVEVLRRGDIRDPLGPARPGAIASIESIEGRFELEDPADEGARRAALAAWLTHRENPLVWRSIVNRIWSRHFGRGIVATPNDLGGFGEAPSHPELLDELARAFRDEGGSLKRLHRVLVLSAAYGRSSVHAGSESRDPENRLLARAPLRRLDAETFRDSILRFAGRLDTRMGGPSDRQFHASAGVHVTPVVDYLGFPPDREENRRRSVYRFVFRTVPDPWFLALDCPDASQLSPGRNESVTVAQALALRHHPFIVDTSERIAARLEREASGIDALVTRLFRLALGRAPEASELALASEYTERHGLANATRWILNLDEVLFLR